MVIDKNLKFSQIRSRVSMLKIDPYFASKVMKNGGLFYGVLFLENGVIFTFLLVSVELQKLKFRKF